MKGAAALKTPPLARRSTAMTESKNANELFLFDTLAKILLRCFVLGYVLLLLWAVVYLFAGVLIYGIADKLFGLTRHEADLINYCGMALVKCAVILLFLIPYIAIRWTLRQRS
jgi:Family of unknown function (DUF6868)